MNKVGIVDRKVVFNALYEQSFAFAELAELIVYE